jgi:hypothetical protein
MQNSNTTRFMTKQEATASVPIGVYSGEFLGVRPFEGESRLGKDGRPMGPSCVWEFAIAAGAHKGAVVSRITGTTPTSRNSAGRMLDAIVGRTTLAGEQIDLETYIGKRYTLTLEVSPNNPQSTRVAQVLPPQVAHGTSPIANGQAPPPPPATETRYYVQVSPGLPPETMSDTELQDWLVRDKRDPAVVQVCRLGEKSWVTASSCGFKDEAPF